MLIYTYVNPRPSLTSLVRFWLVRKIFWPKKRTKQGPGMHKKITLPDRMNFDEISLMIFYCTKGSKWIEVDGFPLVYLHPLIICLSGAQEVLIIIQF